MTSQEDDFLKRLRATFNVEAGEHLQAMSSRLLIWEKKDPGGKQAEHIEAIFRHAHSLKGAARAVDLSEAESICQSLESLFAALKRREIDLTPIHFDMLHRALNLLSNVIPTADGKQAVIDKPRILGIRRELDDLGIALQEGNVHALGGGASSLPSTHPILSHAPTAHSSEARSPIEIRQGMAASSPTILDDEKRIELERVRSVEVFPVATEMTGLGHTVRMSSAKLEQVLLEVEEMLVVKLTTERRAMELRLLEESLGQWKREWGKAESMARELAHQPTPLFTQPGVVIVPGQKIESAGTLSPSAGRNPVQGILEFLDWNFAYFRNLEEKLHGLTRTAARDQHAIGQLVDELLADSKKLLLLPFSTLFDIFPKLVRDLSRAQGKEAELLIHGAEFEMDKRILEEMKDPLIHLVRNCVDHGIEKPGVRTQQNKPQKATITLSVSRLDGNQVEILVADDGAGINLPKVKEAALKQGLISADAASQLSDQQTLDLIFRSAVSTSPIITEISGRGVGLAIVREKAEKSGGRVSVETQPGKGTAFRLTLPLTLATFRGILVRASNQDFVIPIARVDRVARIRAGSIKTVENRETISQNDQIISLARLANVLELPRVGKQEPASEFRSVVVLGAGDRRIAFVVDEVLHEEEVLVKSLGKHLSRVRNISGATILGSGKIVPILNVTDLMKSARKAGLVPIKPIAGAIDSAEEMKQKRILVAEDSITSRMLLKNILESAGHEVRTAVDGIEALTELRTNDFDLIVSDVEMPRMNGFDLTAHIRSDRKLSGKPVILVTALASREDRERGIDVGANAYIIKSSFDQSNLLEAIRRLT